MRYDFMILDVFTDKAFGGNQLAVLTDARGISPHAMQMIAREFDFPETTFVLPPSDPSRARRVRIFTPGGELPFAGHPTVGTACALAIVGHTQVGEAVLEEGVGPVAVTTTNVGGAYSARLRLSRGHDSSEAVPPVEDLAAAVSLKPEEIRAAFCAGLGPKFTYVQLGSREAVDRAQLDLQHWRRSIAESWGAALFVFAGELSDQAELYARMFAPGMGIPEDPATGAAAAAIVGAGATASGQRDGQFRLNIVQGVAMGRPSFISASAFLNDGVIEAIEVGGSCVLVAEGKIEVPDHLVERARG